MKKTILACIFSGAFFLICSLPQNAQNYVKLVEDIVKAPITMIGVGPRRSQVIYKG